MVTALPDDLSGLRDKAILLIGLAGVFRRSEIVGLQVRDIQSSDAGLIITLRRSKTDQEGVSFTKGMPIGISDATCPKRALEAWLQRAGITSGPIFRPVDRWGHVGNHALRSLGVARAVKRALTALEVDTVDYSGHSLCAGLVDELPSRNLALALARRMNAQLRPISWMGMIFLPLPIPSILCQVSSFPFARSISLGVSRACFFTTR
jgi:hypothetical protein